MRTLLSLSVIVLLIAVSASAFAGEETFTVDFDTPKGASSSKVTEEMAQIVAKRLEARFEAAGVKSYKVRPNDTSVTLIVGGDPEPAWLRGLVTAPGTMSLRPVLPNAGPDWRALADVLPPGVEIRGEDARGHLWSATRAPLDRVLKRLTTTDETKVSIAPDVLGWRTITLGEPLATQADLEGVTMSMAPTGAYNVSLAFKADARARLAARSSNGLQTWAVILDDEVVALIPRPATDARVIGIAAPARLGSDVAGQSQWASAIAGRLAAPMPVRLALIKER